MTRRIALGAGLAFASVTCAPGFGAYASPLRRRPEARSIDALLVDETIEMPRQMAAVIKAGWRTPPIVGIQLDAGAQDGLMRVLDKSQTIAGVSSGATLFCLERMAWDHGFRLTARCERGANDAGGEAFQKEVATYLGGAHVLAANPAPLARAYRPSRADGILHAWVMQKTSPQLRQRRREV